MQRYQAQSVSFRRPREFFRAAESSAIRIRKLLRSERISRRATKSSVAMDDAVALTISIEQIARYGQTLTAADATDLAGRLERLFDQLRSEVDSLLVS